MPKKPQHGGKAPSMDQPDPRPPMDTEALSAEAGGARLQSGHHARRRLDKPTPTHTHIACRQRVFQWASPT